MSLITAVRYLSPFGLLLVALVGRGVAAPPAEKDKDRVTIEGKITEVMEIYPPRLNVETKDGRYKVQLSEETKVTANGKPVDFGKLRPNQMIHIKGTRPADSKDALLSASEIEIKVDS